MITDKNTRWHRLGGCPNQLPWHSGRGQGERNWFWGFSPTPGLLNPNFAISLFRHLPFRYFFDVPTTRFEHWWHWLNWWSQKKISVNQSNLRHPRSNPSSVFISPICVIRVPYSSAFNLIRVPQTIFFPNHFSILIIWVFLLLITPVTLWPKGRSHASTLKPWNSETFFPLTRFFCSTF